MENNAHSLKKTTRLAGLLYLLATIFGVFNILYVPSKIMVTGNIAANAKSIISNEFLFRTSTIVDILSSITLMFLALVLYHLLKQVNERQAKAMVALVLVQIPVVFIIEELNISSLMILKGEMLNSFEPIKRQYLAMLFLEINGNITMTLIAFWGLWLIPFGQLVYKSGIIPRILGVMLILGGTAYLIQSFTALLLPDNSQTINKFTFVFYSLAELSTMLWLLIKGVKRSYE